MSAAPTFRPDDPWYRVSDMPPPLTVRVRVQWDGRMFVAARGAEPRSGKVVWVEVTRHGMHRVTLPGEPELWQPLYPAKWQGRLPEPVTLATAGRMWSSSMSFQAVEDATSEELARDMERDREMARNGTGGSTRFHPMEPGVLWWRDITTIKYQQAPDITLKHCEGRVMRALAFAGVQGPTWHGKGRVKTLAETLAALAKAREMAGSDDSSPVPRFQQLPADRDDFDVAMSWFTALNPVELRPARAAPDYLTIEQVVMCWRALSIPLSFAEIGVEVAKLPRSDVRDGGWRGHQRAQQVFVAAVEKCWRAANGLRVHKQLKVKDQIADLREGNRAHKRRAVG